MFFFSFLSFLSLALIIDHKSHIQISRQVLGITRYFSFITGIAILVSNENRAIYLLHCGNANNKCALKNQFEWNSFILSAFAFFFQIFHQQKDENQNSHALNISNVNICRFYWIKKSFSTTYSFHVRFFYCLRIIQNVNMSMRYHWVAMDPDMRSMYKLSCIWFRLNLSKI